MIAGTPQPNPTIRGTKAFPGSPSALIRRSITKAALAIYPESSRKDKAKNKQKMTGMNVETH